MRFDQILYQIKEAFEVDTENTMVSAALGLMARRPILTVTSTASGYGVTEFLHVFNPIIQAGIGVTVLGVGILTFILKFREIRRGK